MSDSFHLLVDGVSHRVTAGETLLDLLKRLDAEVPSVCYHPALGPLETCDTCMVEVDGLLRRSCATEVAPDMKVAVESSRALESRREAMQRILGNHELYCTICDYNNGDCEVHNAAGMLGIEHQKYPFTRKGSRLDTSNPFYQYDPDQCVLCARCVEACQDVQVTETLSIDWNAGQPRVLWDGGEQIEGSSCVSCGHCITVCPCNALMEKTMLGQAGHFTAGPDKARRDSIELVKFTEQFTGLGPLFATSKIESEMRKQTIRSTKTVCTYCGVGCAFDVWTKGRHILKVQPDKTAPANGISTCVKGKFGWDFVNSDDRLTEPLIRRNGRFEAVSWEEALGEVVRRFREVEATYGGDHIALISSSKTTNEECYLIQKIARVIFRSNNIDNCTRYCQSPASKGLSRTVGYGADSGTMNDIEKAGLVLLIGSNTSASHPVLAARIRRQVKLHGQRLIVSDLREHEMARWAHRFLQPKPASDLVWVNAIARYIIEQGWEDRDFIDRRTKEFDLYRESLETFSLEYASEVTGLSIDDMKRTAREIAEAESVCCVWAMGVTQQINGTDTCTAFCNLLLLTGNFGRPGTGAYPLRGHNNVQGSCDFGAVFNYLPGYGKVADDEARGRFEKAWGVELPSTPGYNNRTMLDAARENKIRAMLVMGEELGLVDANANLIQDTLRKLDFLVVQDIFMSTTARFADVVLPGTPSLEKDGTFVNTERRIQRLNQVFEPRGNSRPDWMILRDLAAALGHDWGYRHPGEIMDEVADIVPEFAGVRYHRLEGYNSLCWPVAEDGTDTPLLYTERFHSADGKASFYPVGWTTPVDAPSDEYPFHLNNGRVLEHFHEGNLTYRVPGTTEKVSEAFVAMSPGDAERLMLEEGEWVRLRSPYGKVDTQVVVSEEMRDGEFYMPVCSSAHRINYLTSNAVDPMVDTPAFKEIAVSLEKLGKRDPSPLPPGNPRYGRPTPQVGVQVADKWERRDYRPVREERPVGGRV